MLGLEWEVYCNSAFSVVSTTFNLPIPHNCSKEWFCDGVSDCHCGHTACRAYISAEICVSVLPGKQPSNWAHIWALQTTARNGLWWEGWASRPGTWGHPWGATRAVQAAVGAPGTATNVGTCATPGWWTWFSEQGSDSSHLCAPLPMTLPGEPKTKPREPKTPPQSPDFTLWQHPVSSPFRWSQVVSRLRGPWWIHSEVVIPSDCVAFTTGARGLPKWSHLEVLF